MAYTSDPSSRINELVPRWDRSNPTTYSYDPKNYSPSDYEEFRKARLENDQKRQAKAEADLKKTMKDVGKTISDKMREQLTNSLQPGDVLTIDRPSTCFKSVEWEATSEEDDDGEVDGVVTGEFHRGGDLVYSGPMTLSEFMEWSADESVGGFYNDTKPF